MDRECHNCKFKRTNIGDAPCCTCEISSDWEPDYPTMVAILVKPDEEILKSLQPGDLHLWHMGTGVAGEGGELLDAIKKYVVYRKPLDRENVIEELGDLEFFMEGIRALIGVTREQVLEANQNKLKKRYSTMSYSDQQAQTRADKAE